MGLLNYEDHICIMVKHLKTSISYILNTANPKLLVQDLLLQGIMSHGQKGESFSQNYSTSHPPPSPLILTAGTNGGKGHKIQES